MDAARSALRLGAERATIVYRRGRAELPACAAELHEVEAEGVRFSFLAEPVAILDGADGRVRGLRCARMSLGEPDESGRRRPQPTGEEFELDAEQVIVALGSRAAAWLAETASGLETDAAGRVVVDESGSTSVPGIYAGGDVVRGAATVVDAVGDGKRAAAAIDSQLRRGPGGRR
jgi:glutamate synthase (NADPH/NADH) small chain